MDNILQMLCIFFCVYFVQSYKLEGRVHLGRDNSLANAKVVVDDGLYKAFVRSDGSFTVHNVPTGSYVVEVITPTYLFEPVRVDVSTKGNIRARKLNHMKPSAVSIIRYPLDMKPLGLVNYFQKVEKFSILDMLKSPMVIMMLLPLVMLVILPKMMNASDPETRKEMENSMSMFNQNSSQMPDMAEMMSNFFGGSKKKPPKAVTSGKSGKPQKRRKAE